MFCKNCGTQNTDDARFCAKCGADMNAQNTQNAQNAGFDPYAQNAAQNPQPQDPMNNMAPGMAPGANQPAPDPAKGLAIASMVCGIVSFFCFAVVLGTLAIIFGGVAKSKGSRSGMATAGIVCGAIGLALWLIMLIACPTFSLLPF